MHNIPGNPDIIPQPNLQPSNGVVKQENFLKSLVFGNLKAITLVMGFLQRVTGLGRKALTLTRSHIISKAHVMLTGCTMGRRFLRQCCPCIRHALLSTRMASKLAQFNQVIVFELSKDMQSKQNTNTSRQQVQPSKLKTKSKIVPVVVVPGRVKDTLSLIFNLVNLVTNRVTKATLQERGSNTTTTSTG